ncbi:uncharacterized protein LOC105681602 [Bombus impatiens]|uniref:Uncharacterized protein LOC105681602 n=1 Tax=Bombus impatiens TaxID=132113 RepID=A0A6P6FJ42_BOMIM|nr:uncharacterized protein LOC105681602 [Bombus impatiens]
MTIKFVAMRYLLLLVIAVLAVTGNAFAEIREIPTKCPESSGKTVQLAHKHDCTKFYECSNGQKQLSNCPEFAPGQKLHFDPELQNCTFPWEANCASRAPDCSTDEFIQPHPSNCRLYYKCENGEKVLKMCDEGQLFNFDSLECVDKNATKCKVYDSCPTGKLLETVLLPHECNYKYKSLYYECVDGQYVERDCASGQVFNNRRRQCVSDVYCPENGTKYIPDKTDCTLYYECVNGVKTQKTCEDGLSFNEMKGMCTWPPGSECSLNLFKQTELAISFLPDATKENIMMKCPANGNAFVPHERSCTKYYACVNGRQFIENCPEGMIYDYIRKVCDAPYAAVCKNKMTHYKIRLRGIDSNCHYSNDCPTYGSKRLKHEKDCRLYYDCENGYRCLRSCLEEYVFNPLIESCDIPKNNRNCFTSGGSDPSENECDCGCKNWIRRFPNPKNCSLYYECENGKKVSKECAPDLQYSRDSQSCTYPKDAKCIVSDCEEGKFYHHDYECNKYYVCRHGEKESQYCPSGQKFDWIDLECKPSSRVRCYPEGIMDGCEGKCSSTDTTLPHEDCRKYCKCENGNSKIEICPNKQFYDRETHKCEWPENLRNVSCEPFPCWLNSTGTNIPHKCHCDKYYRCRNGMKYLVFCKDGKYFDYEQERCVDSAEAHCYANSPYDVGECAKIYLTHNNFVHENCTKYYR